MKTKMKLVVMMCFAVTAINAQCKDISVNQLTNTLKGLILPSLKIKLDRDNSYLSILGKTENFKIPAYDLKKAGRDWRYHVQDIRSKDANLWFNKERLQFVLDVKFEGDKSEIKGKCPGCLRRFRDRRAPDINWKNPQIARLFFRIIPYNRSVTLDITEVKLIGEFDVNGPLESFFPRIIRNQEQKIKSQVQNEAKTILNNYTVKSRIANEIRPLLSAIGVRTVSDVRLSTNGQNLSFCQ